jgi:hypothetical protein
MFAGLMMVPTTFGHRGAPESVAQQIKTIEALLDAAKYSPTQCRLIWHSLVQRYLGVIEPDLSADSKVQLIEEVKREIAAQYSEPGGTI